MKSGSVPGTAFRASLLFSVLAEPTICSAKNIIAIAMRLSRHSFPLGKCLFAVAVLVDLHVASAQTFKYPEGATPTEFQGFVTSVPGLGECLSTSTHPIHRLFKF
jgi:hypothetical protein